MCVAHTSMKVISSSCMRAEMFKNQQDFGAVAQDLQTTQDAPNNVPAQRLQLPHGPGRPGAGADALDDRGDPRLRPVGGRTGWGRRVPPGLRGLPTRRGLADPLPFQRTRPLPPLGPALPKTPFRYAGQAAIIRIVSERTRGTEGRTCRTRESSW